MLNQIATAAIWMPGWQEMIVFGVIALIIFGPIRLPALARCLGSSITDFKKGMAGIHEELEEAVNDVKKEGKDIEKSMKS